MADKEVRYNLSDKEDELQRLLCGARIDCVHFEIQGHDLAYVCVGVETPMGFFHVDFGNRADCATVHVTITKECGSTLGLKEGDIEP
jgi:hypothetical protein